MMQSLRNYVTNFKKLITRNNTISGTIAPQEDSVTNEHLNPPLQMLSSIQYMEWMMEKTNADHYRHKL